MVKQKQILDFQKFTSDTKVLFVLKTLEDAGFEAYLAGGAVRDMLLNKKPFDFDITTNARPKDVKLLFPKHITRGEAFGTITAILDENETFEITTYRSEDVYTNSRHPDQIKFSESILEDSSRRDFTINSLYADRYGKILDFQNGLDDLQNQKIKTVGNPDERFKEDALRVLRAFRFASQLDFSMDPMVQRSAIENWSNLSKVSSERIYVEMKKMVLAKHFYKVLPILINNQLFDYFVDSNIYPKSKLNIQSIENHLIQRLQNRNLVNYNFEDFFLEYSVLVTPNYEQYLNAWMEFLTFRKQEKNKIEDVIYLFKVLELKAKKSISDKMNPKSSVLGQILRLGLKSYSVDQLKEFLTEDLLKIFNLENEFIEKLLGKLGQLQESPLPLVTAKDLMDLGVKPGPDLRNLINKAFEFQLEDSSLTKSQLCKMLSI